MTNPVSRRVAALALSVATATAAWAGVGTPAGAAPPEPAAVPGELLVGYHAGATTHQREQARARASAQMEEQVVEGQGARGVVERVRLPKGADRSAAARRLERDPAVAYAEPNWIVTHAATSTDPYYADNKLWGMYGDTTSPKNEFGSQAGEAWAAGNTGSKTVYVGVIDEGIQHSHPDLQGQVVNPGETADGKDNDGNGFVDDIHGWDFVSNDNTVYDGGTRGSADDHGTHVAGTIGAKADDTGVVGVAWNVRMISGKFLGPRGGTIANAIKATDYFTDLKTKRGLAVVATNNSWGGGGFSQGMLDAITRANTANILFIAAAGNDGRDNDSTASYPSGYAVDNVIAVAAIDQYGSIASFSNYGARTVDLGAPGVSVNSTTAFNTYSSYSGTSMATPHVTGAAVLYAAATPGATAAALKQSILDGAFATQTASLAGKTVTGGRLNVGSVGVSPNTAPTATITSPTGGSTVAGTSVDIAIASSDSETAPAGLSVEWSIDGGGWRAAEWDGFTHVAIWDSTGVVNGSHTINARVTDEAGAVVLATPVAVTVANEIDDVSPSDVVTVTGASTSFGNQWMATATVTVTSAGQPRAGAVVEGFWSYSTTSAVSCTTSDSGACPFESDLLAKRVSSVTFSVTSIDGVAAEGGITITKP